MTPKFTRPVHHAPDGDSFQDHKDRGSVNPGQDYKVGVGTPVFAPGNGSIAVDDDGAGGDAGISIVIYHDTGEQAGWSSDLLHLSRNVVKRGQWVREDDLIGYSGDTGVGAAHLHWTLRTRHSAGYNGVGNVNPEKYVKKVASNPWDDIRAIQKAANVWLKHFGRTPLVEDGVAGPRTKAAINYLQKAFGLAIDGKVGPKTWARLIQKPPATTPDPPVVVPPIEPPVTEPPVVVPPIDPPIEPPIIDPEEPPVTDPQPPVVQPDPTKIEEALATLGKQARPFIPKAFRKKVYKGVKWAAGVSAAIGVSGLAVAPAVGGDIGAKIALGAGIAAIVGSGLGALASSLADDNTDTSLDA